MARVRAGTPHQAASVQLGRFVVPPRTVKMLWGRGFQGDVSFQSERRWQPVALGGERWACDNAVLLQVPRSKAALRGFLSRVQCVPAESCGQGSTYVFPEESCFRALARIFWPICDTAFLGPWPAPDAERAPASAEEVALWPWGQSGALTCPCLRLWPSTAGSPAALAGPVLLVPGLGPGRGLALTTLCLQCRGELRVRGVGAQRALVSLLFQWHLLPWSHSWPAGAVITVGPGGQRAAGRGDLVGAELCEASEGTGTWSTAARCWPRGTHVGGSAFTRFRGGRVFRWPWNHH